MTTIRILSAALFVTLIALTASAQAQPMSGASTPMASASMPHDCARPMAKHDHSAEKGMPTPKSMSGPCAPAAAASASKAKPRHDHASSKNN